ncbi:MAG: hypothetical protein AAGB15_01185 [Pseudomonadota bacterium]
MITELSELTQWESDLMRDLAVTRGRAADLRRSLDALVRCLPIAERRDLRADIARLEIPVRGRRLQAQNMTDKVIAIHDYLAAADDTVTALELQAHLEKLGLADRPGAASIILSRKVGQGLVERLSRGRYRVNPHHPEISARRVAMG